MKDKKLQKIFEDWCIDITQGSGINIELEFVIKLAFCCGHKIGKKAAKNA